MDADQAAAFSLQTVGRLVLWSRTIPAYVTSLQPGIGSRHGVCRCPGGHNRAQSDFTATERSAVGRYAQCQVSGGIIPGPRKKNPPFVKALFIVTPHFFLPSATPGQAGSSDEPLVEWTSVQ